MTNNEINEAIAISVGWKSYPYVTINGIKHNGIYWANDKDFDIDNPPAGTFVFGGRVPNYTEDLNAMHLALLSQSKSFRLNFERLMDSHCEEKHKPRYEVEAKDFAEIFLQAKRE